MSSDLKVLQVIPKLGYGGAETGCYDIAHYLPENGCKSFLVTSGGELIKFINKEKVKLIRLPVHSKNPLIILFNTLALIFIIILNNISIVHARSRAPAWSCFFATKVTKRSGGATFLTKNSEKIPTANHPPNTPDQVLLGLILGKTLGPPNIRPVKYPAESVKTTTPINQIM